MQSCYGLCIYSERTVLLDYNAAQNGMLAFVGKHCGCVSTLVHELIHVYRGPSFPHGADFLASEERLCNRLGLPRTPALPEVQTKMCEDCGGVYPAGGEESHTESGDCEGRRSPGANTNTGIIYL